MQLLIQGQPVFFNQELNHVKLTIEEPFMSAGKKFDWGYKSPGLGFNLKIIEFVLKRRLTIVVRVGTVNKHYFIRYDVLLDFLSKHNTDYKIRDTILKIIPWELFTPILLTHRKGT